MSIYCAYLLWIHSVFCVFCRIFGFVARKQGSPTDNACHIFAELDADQPGSAIVEFIMKVMLGRGRSKQDSV